MNRSHNCSGMALCPPRVKIIQSTEFIAPLLGQINIYNNISHRGLTCHRLLIDPICPRALSRHDEQPQESIELPSFILIPPLCQLASCFADYQKSSSNSGRAPDTGRQLSSLVFLATAKHSNRLLMITARIASSH